ncbi:MAG: hypothetical protein RMM53_08620, partial [Bacteroidia bacterium]|nr:hypothetical protein [Bacteroidia bacterium]
MFAWTGNWTGKWIGVAAAKIVFGAAVLHVLLNRDVVADYAGFAARWAQGCLFTDDRKTDGFVCLTMPFWILAGGNVYGAGATLALLALSGAWAAAAAMRVFGRWTKAQTRVALATLIFAPCAWLWTALPGKETLMFAAAGWTLWAWGQIERRRVILGAGVMVVCLVAVVWVRPYLAAAMTLSLPALVLMRRAQTAVVVAPVVFAAMAAL